MEDFLRKVFCSLIDEQEGEAGAIRVPPNHWREAMEVFLWEKKMLKLGMHMLRVHSKITRMQVAVCLYVTECPIWSYLVLRHGLVLLLIFYSVLVKETSKSTC